MPSSFPAGIYRCHALPSYYLVVPYASQIKNDQGHMLVALGLAFEYTSGLVILRETFPKAWIVPWVWNQVTSLSIIEQQRLLKSTERQVLIQALEFRESFEPLVGPLA